MAKSNNMLVEPEHDPNDALLVCVLYLKTQKMNFHIKIPGLEGTIPESRHSEPYLSELIVKCLRTVFGQRVGKA